MVDWDRVEELRSKGLGWSEIADDSKVGFHADVSAGDPGRALRALYHRSRARGRGKAPAPSTPKKGGAAGKPTWSLIRIGYLAFPLVAVWFLIAYLVPSPVGLLVPAIPYLGLVLAVVAFVFFFLLWRTSGRRWSSVYRGTVIGGVVLGLAVAGLIGLSGILLFGCPYLPPSSALSHEPDNWTAGHGISPWQENGKPVVYFYGATWCPYCSASSWAFYKAMTQFGTVTGATFSSYSSPSDAAGPSTPEVVLAGVQLNSPTISWQVSEDTSGIQGTSVATSSCYQLAYVAAYGGGTIPFGVINGQYVHAGATFVLPNDLKNYELTGDLTVKGSVLNETGTPWTVIQDSTWWIMTFLAKASGKSIGFLANAPGASKWSAATISAVETDMNQTY